MLLAVERSLSLKNRLLGAFHALVTLTTVGPSSSNLMFLACTANVFSPAYSLKLNLNKFSTKIDNHSDGTQTRIFSTVG